MKTNPKSWLSRFAKARRSLDPRLMGMGALVSGVSLGVALAYFFDRQLGRRRRSWARDKMVHAAYVGGRRFTATEHHLTNRARGMFAQLRSLSRRVDESDEIVEARIRLALGRACSHPAAIDLKVQGGRVVLSGAVLEREHKNVLCRLARVRGVHGIDDQLERHEHATSTLHASPSSEALRH